VILGERLNARTVHSAYTTDRERAAGNATNRQELRDVDHA
jgi:hypothetical protein